MKHDMIYYSVGALLYCPADNRSVASSLIQERFGRRFSLALCLEDTIGDDHVAEAELTLIRTLSEVQRASRQRSFYLPNIFIRVRNAGQIPDLLNRLGSAGELVAGWILPKFSTGNADAYIEAVLEAGRQYGRRIYMMPILESPDLIRLDSRADFLYSLKKKLDAAGEPVLNIRVGGNDLCHLFGFRRHADESIHDIRPVSNIFADIVTVFGTDYVVSGPVWEYYDGDRWASGLRRELAGDRLCGFIGKTVIHPRQIPLVNQSCQVSRQDLEDARAILGWDPGAGSLVRGSADRTRMNEYKTHSNWAEKILMLAELYGVRQQPSRPVKPMEPQLPGRYACTQKTNSSALPDEKIIPNVNIWSSTGFKGNMYR